MAKTLDFKDFMVVDYAPGMDPIIKRAAKKRKMDSGAGSNAEYSSTYAPGEQVDTIDENIGGLFKNASEWESSAKARGLVVKSMTHPSGEATKYQIAKDKQGNNRGHFDHGTKSGRLKEEVELDEALNSQQRRMRALQMKRKQAKIELGRERASRRFADKDRLMTRARRAARTRMFKVLTKGASKSELPYQRRQEIEKRLDSPVMKKVIDRLAMKMLPKERQAEIQRHKSGGQQ